jgi:hypothetical protein
MALPSSGPVGSRRRATVRALALLADEAMNSTGPAFVAPNQCGVRVSKLGRLSGRENQVVLAEDDSDSAVEDVDPVVALGGARAGSCSSTPVGRTNL